MALITCPECGKEISSNASSCPFCGNPMIINEERHIICPKCGSRELSVGKKGFSGTKAFVGAVTFGNIGVLAGTHKSNKIVITCLKCGHQFAPGEGATSGGLKVNESYGHIGGIRDEDKEQMEGYICDCGKESTVPKQSPYCPKCGRYLTERNHQAFIDSFNMKNNSGCFGIVILIAIPLGIFGLLTTTLF